MKRVVAVLALVLIAMVGCSSGSEETSTDAGAGVEQPPFELNDAPVETTEVGLVKSYKFDPPVILVDAGSEVTWTNEDDFPHNVHFFDASGTTHDLPIGESVTVAFDETGEFYYECSIHPQTMRGKVIAE